MKNQVFISYANKIHLIKVKVSILTNYKSKEKVQ